MSVVSIVATIVYVALTIFLVAMWARFVLDLVRTLSRDWRPRGAGLLLAEGVYTLTDPPIKTVRKVVPPLRVGNLALDLAWPIVMLAVIILISITVGFVN